jgi:hypothetical protein
VLTNEQWREVEMTGWLLIAAIAAVMFAIRHYRRRQRRLPPRDLGFGRPRHDNAADIPVDAGSQATDIADDLDLTGVELPRALVALGRAGLAFDVAGRDPDLEEDWRKLVFILFIAALQIGVLGLVVWAIFSLNSLEAIGIAIIRGLVVVLLLALFRTWMLSLPSSR